MFEELSWFVLAIILVTIIINHFTQSKHLPPGPFRLLINGNSHKLAADSRHVDLMAMEKQYGHVFRLYLGSQLVVVVSGVNAVEEVLITKSAEFVGRPNFYTGEPYSQGEAIALADYSPHWRLHRKITVSALRMYIHEVLRQGTVINDEFDLLEDKDFCLVEKVAPVSYPITQRSRRKSKEDAIFVQNTIEKYAITLKAYEILHNRQFCTSSHKKDDEWERSKVKKITLFTSFQSFGVWLGGGFESLT